MAEREGCLQAAELMPLVAAGTATTADRARVRSHVADCDGCAQELADLCGVADGLRSGFVALWLAHAVVSAWFSRPRCTGGER
jgi:hypothetical protein